MGTRISKFHNPLSYLKHYLSLPRLCKLLNIMGSSCSSAVIPSCDGTTSNVRESTYSTIDGSETYSFNRCPTESFVTATMQEVEQKLELRASVRMNEARAAPAARRKTSVYSELTEATAISSVVGHVFESEKILWESRLKWIPREQREPQIARELISM